MSTIIVDGKLTAQLRQLNQPVQLCDSDGRVLGWFTPVVDLSEWDINEPPPLDKEELERRKTTAKRLSTKEFLAELEKL